MNTRSLIRIILSSYVLAELQAVGALAIYGQPVSVNYSASASGYGPLAQTAVFQATVEDFIATYPDSIPLFDVSIGADRISITALRTFTVPPNSFMNFNWKFALTPAAGLSFDSATLISSSLFSIPPFTFPVNPPVSFDATAHSISVGGFIADGVGNGTVNNGGVAVVGFTVVPEPSNWALFALGTGAVFLSGRRARQQIINLRYEDVAR